MSMKTTRLSADRSNRPGTRTGLHEPIELHLSETPNLRNPIMVVGLPDSGRVAKIVLDHLIKTLHATKIGYLYSDYLPPRLLMTQEGQVDLMKHEIYCWVNEEAKQDLLLYTGDAQPILPEGAYRLSETVIDLAEKFGVSLVVTVGAFITGKLAENPSVYGAASEVELIDELKKLDVKIIDSGAVTWMNGLIPGLAKVRKLQGLFLSGETSGFMVDPRAAMIILRVLTKKLGLDLDLSELEKQAGEVEVALKKAAAGEKLGAGLDQNKSEYIG